MFSSPQFPETVFSLSSREEGFTESARSVQRERGRMSLLVFTNS